MVTISDIAKRAGVSVATVSRTLRAPETVRQVRRDRVRQAIEEMNYSPNAIARQLRRQRNEAIIVIVPEIANPFFSNIVQSIENVAHDLGYRVLIGETQNKQERIDYYAEMVLTRAADGLILLGSILPSVITEGLGGDADPPIPLVLACERFEGLNCPNVLIDNVGAARLAVSHLVDRGCRKIATIAGPTENTLGQDRLLGYRQALGEAGLPDAEEQVAIGDFSIDSGYAAMQVLLDRGLDLDGVFCANDEMAIGAQKAIRERGLAMPGDVAVVGFDDLRFGNFTVPPLTTIQQPTSEMGEVAMYMMDALLKKRPIENHVVVLPHQLVERDSTGRT